MAKTATAPANMTPRKPPPAQKAGKGKYLFKMAGLKSVEAGPEYSTAHGAVVEGERFMFGLLRMPKGTGAAAHHHPNEQWVYIIEGELAFEIDGKKGVARPGSLLYIPPNAVHSTLAAPDRDAVFLTGKDLSHGLWGKPVDAKAGPRRAKPAARAKTPARRKR